MVPIRNAAQAALASGRPALVWRRRIADTETPVAAALKLIEPGRGDFLLESVEGGAVRGRHSMIGLAPDLVFRAQGNEAAVNPHWLTDRDAFSSCPKPTLAALRDLVASCRMDVPEELPRALACLVGYFGYETIGLVNEQLWLGHFELWSSSGILLYRQATLVDRDDEDAALSLEAAQLLVETAIDECERFYPVFQFVLWGGKSPREAIAAALIDTQGEA